MDHDAPDVAGLRRTYRRGVLRRADLPGTWLEAVAAWLDDAVTSGALTEPNACVMATATADGTPSARTVLLKGLDERGLVVYTHRTSRKGREALATGRAALCFSWVPLERQVCVTGRVETVPDAETRDYFASRPRGSQVGAWASPQSEVVAGRDELERRREEVERRFAAVDVLPVPPTWGGLRVVPDAVELWQGRPDRLHDRLRYRDDGGTWVLERLGP